MTLPHKAVVTLGHVIYLYQEAVVTLGHVIYLYHNPLGWLRGSLPLHTRNPSNNFIRVGAL